MSYYKDRRVAKKYIVDQLKNEEPDAKIILNIGLKWGFSKKFFEDTKEELEEYQKYIDL